MDLISSVSPISPSNKVQHGPFGACSGIFRYKLSAPPCLNKTVCGISWSTLGYLPKVRARSNPLHTSLGEQLGLLVQNCTIDRAAATLVQTHPKLKHSNLKMRNWNTEYTDSNDVIYMLPKQPPSNKL